MSSTGQYPKTKQTADQVAQTILEEDRTVTNPSKANRDRPYAERKNRLIKLTTGHWARNFLAGLGKRDEKEQEGEDDST